MVAVHGRNVGVKEVMGEMGRWGCGWHVVKG